MKPTEMADAPPVAAPRPVVNPAGDDALAARVGTHRTFLAAMLARLASKDYPELAALRTRRPDDPSLALWDAWATAADVLTFYTEKAVNEGYLRTARERRSLVELANLIGYRPGPGVAANVFLAFQLDKGPQLTAVETVIQAGTAAKSVPTDDQHPQTFETSEPLAARAEWNALRPRMTLPQKIDGTTFPSLDAIFVDAANAPVKANDRVLVSFTPDDAPVVAVVREVVVDPTGGWTVLRLEESGFSVPKMLRKTADAIAQFTGTLNPPAGFQFLTEAIDAAKKLRDGDTTVTPKRSALKDWKRLSEFDKYLSSWLPPNENPDGMTKAEEEFLKPDSKFTAIVGALSATIRKGNALFASALAVCNEFDLWDQVAVNSFRAVKTLSGTDPDAMKDALKRLNELVGAVSARELPSTYSAVITDLIAKVAACTAPIGADPVAFRNARAKLQTFWGLTAAAGSLSANSQNLAAIFATLRSDLGAAAHLDDKRKAIDDANTALAGFTPTGGSPPPDPTRASIPRDTIVTFISEAETTLATVATPTDTSSGQSVILASLADFLNSLIDPVTHTGDTFGKRLEAAIAAEPTTRPAVEGIQRLIDMKISFDSDIKALRDLFGQRAAIIQGSFIDIGTSPGFPAGLKDIWTDAKAALGQLTAGIHLTMAALGEPDSPDGPTELFKRLADFGLDVSSASRRALSLDRDLRTFVGLDGGSGVKVPAGAASAPTAAGGIAGAVADPSAPATLPPVVYRTAEETLALPPNTAADIVAQLVAVFDAGRADEMRAKWSAVRNRQQTAVVAPLSAPYALFGHTAPRQIFDKGLEIIQPPKSLPPDWIAVGDDFSALYLAAELPALVGPTYAIVKYKDGTERLPLRIAASPQVVSRSDYGLTLKVTKCAFDPPVADWRPPPVPPAAADPSIAALRTTLVQVPGKALPLGERPISAAIGLEAADTDATFLAEKAEIELDGIYLGLRPGHLVIVTGKRVNLPGVVGRELRRIKLAQHILRDLPGDQVHTRIFLDAPLAFTYVRETVKVYANVAPATHGETVREVCGAGEAGTAFQRFSLRRSPLTYLPAPTPAGVRSTVAVRVNDLLWHELDTLLEAGEIDRVYAMTADDAGLTTVQFGDGKTGARLPTGKENVRAEYRVGLGAAGNVRAEAVTQLAHRPLGVKEVTNPLPATGGADADTVEQIRVNAPLGVMALDRLVSVADYADFTRNYAGIDKAVARRVTVGTQPTVHVTYAATDDAPLDNSSDLIVNLHEALLDYGDPLVAVQLARRDLLILIISAGVGLEPDYEWESVEQKVRAALYDGLGFARRSLAQPVYLSEVQAIIQTVKGVRFVDVDALGAIAQTDFDAAIQDGTRLKMLFDTIRTATAAPPFITVQGTRVVGGVARPAQIAVLSGAVSDSLFLREVTP